MSTLQPPTLIVAIVYGDGARVAPVLDRIIGHLARQGRRLAGLVQRDRVRVGRSRCDMLMEDLATGETLAISQDRGEGARGCRLDVEALLNAAMRVRDALGKRPDLLVINKFGKTEIEGGGCRSLIAEAVERGVPVLIAVPLGNLEAWRNFAGDLATEHALDTLPASTAEICRRLGLARAGAASSARPLPVTLGNGVA
jgi:nucleoside-triphosphatase THEP1